MQIAILVKEFPPDIIGGTETQTLRMAREIQARTTHEVTVYTKAYDRSSPLDTEFDVVRVPNWRRSSLASTLTFCLFAFAYLVRDRDSIDVLQCMMIYPTGYVAHLFSRLTGRPYFAWIRGGDYYFMKDDRVKRWTMERVFDTALVLVQTEGIRQDVLREFPDASLRVLGNGVDVPDQTADGEGVVFIGRLVDDKGVDVLLRAMADIDERLVIVGDGPQRASLEQLAEEVGVEAEFVGEVAPGSVTDYLLNAKVFVLPSVIGEGLPNAVLEAMAAGVPVVVTDTGGVADTVDHEETGLVVEPGDVAELRSQLRHLLTQDDTRAEMGRQAREFILSTRSWDALVDSLNDVYETVVTGQSHGGVRETE